jgi:type III secretion inner rod protein HrpB2
MGLPLDIPSLMHHVAVDPASAPPRSVDVGASSLGVQFETLMQRGSTPPTVGSGEASETVSRFVLSQQEELDRTLGKVNSLVDDMPGMSMTELAQAGAKISLDFANMNFGMQAKMAVVDSTKSAIDTLMRQ